MGIPAMIRFGRAICGDLPEAERREWWLANGLGAYAAGTMERGHRDARGRRRPAR